jgi:Single-strand binding protein family
MEIGFKMDSTGGCSKTQFMPVTTPWVRVAYFGEGAESLVGRLQKGVEVYCEGRLKLDTWTAKDGVRRKGNLGGQGATIVRSIEMTTQIPGQVVDLYRRRSKN